MVVEEGHGRGRLFLQATNLEDIPQDKEHKLMCCDVTNCPKCVVVLGNEQSRKGLLSAIFGVIKLWVNWSVYQTVNGVSEIILKRGC